MPRKSNKLSHKRSHKRSNTGRKTRTRTRKQKTIVMIGCSKKNKKSCKNKVFSTLGNKACPICGQNCHCEPNCNCSHPCPGDCYLNRRMKKHRGGGHENSCGSCGCPIPPMSIKAMNQFGGNMGTYPEVLNQPVMPDIKGNYQDILGINQNGGSCSVCGQTLVMPNNQLGGNFFKQIGAMPGPIVGKAWGPDKLPGENGLGGDRNYLKPYNTNDDPQQQMSINDTGYLSKNSMVGGYRYDKKSCSSGALKKGGGLIPEDLVNLGRDFSYNFKSAYNALNGYKAPVDPAPYKGQLTGTLNNNKFIL